MSKIPKAIYDEIVGLRDLTISLKKENIGLDHRQRQNQVTIDYNMRQLNNLAFDAIIQSGHSPNTHRLDVDTMKIEKLAKRR